MPGTRQRSAVLDALADHQRLTTAWEQVRRNDLQSGRRSAEISAFGSGLGERLPQLAQALRARIYGPRPLRAVTMPKRRGGTRELHIPTVADRIIERALADLLEEHLDAVFTPWSFAYRPGLSVLDAVSRVAGFRDAGATHVARADIANCFPSLQRARLLDRFAALTDDGELVCFVRGLVERPVRRCGRLVHLTRGIPQGSPLSPLLSNLYLHDLDLRLLARRLAAVRYSDDLTIAADSEQAARAALTVLREELEALGLQLRDDGGQVMSFAEGFAFLGEEFTADFPQRQHTVGDDTVGRTLYVHRPGAFIKLREGQLQVVEGADLLLAVPVAHVSRIVLFGGVSMSGYARSHALYSQLPVTFISSRGRWLGDLRSATTASVALRRRQYALTGNEPRRLEIASRIIVGKIANQRSLLLRFAPGRRTDLPLEVAAELDHARRRAGPANLQQLRGVEGGAAQRYFQALGSLLPPGLGYSGRSRRPARDLVNAALNLGYAVLIGEATAALAAAGLDPAIGIMHSTEDRRGSLALDLMEEFRPLIVDAAVVRLIRRGSLSAASLAARKEEARFTDEAKTRLLVALETRLLMRFAHVPSGQRTSYRRALFLQARALAACVRDPRARYEAVRWRR